METKQQKIAPETPVHELPLSDELKAIFLKRGFETLGEIMSKPIGLHQQYLDLSVHQLLELQILFQ